ncbi:MAG: KamA family radical SAM protein [Chitinivibrionales bacterium]|nr:KamA family radical SAM protein [Chitinivibrionales bacterium]
MNLVKKCRDLCVGFYSGVVNEGFSLASRLPLRVYQAPYHTLKFITKSRSELLQELRASDRSMYEILVRNTTIEEDREAIDVYLQKKESLFGNSGATNRTETAFIFQRANVLQCIRVFKNIIRQDNERMTGESALFILKNAVKNTFQEADAPTKPFLCEIIHLLLGINAKAPLFLDREEKRLKEQTVSTGAVRFHRYAEMMNQQFQRFTKGTDPALVARRKGVRETILAYCGGEQPQWQDYRWHLEHLFTTVDAISSIVHLDDRERSGLAQAFQEHISVQITPYYLSLFNPHGRDESDRTIRAQVLPSLAYCTTVAGNRKRGVNMDYMREHETSPIAAITRRYPHIVVLKVFDSCPQICVYCQRNWEVRGLERVAFDERKIDRAITWIKNHHEVSEVLVTGGDPLTLDNATIGRIIDRLADIDSIERIRIGTRTIVTLPCRIDDGFLKLLKTYHKPLRREIVIMTHVESPVELTSETCDAVSKIRQCGISVYNQQVFTYYNSRKFETAFLRKNLKLCGIDPYYSFNTKGKEETVDFRVPIARLLQEQKEEARLLPGVVRTDEAVFNVPGVGKSHLRAWQDHEPIMILHDGRRVYRFHSWESCLRPTQDFLYTDVSIYEYLKRLHDDGEDIDHYQSIWYYF